MTWPWSAFKKNWPEFFRDVMKPRWAGRLTHGLPVVPRAGFGLEVDATGLVLPPKTGTVIGVILFDCGFSRLTAGCLFPSSICCACCVVDKFVRTSRCGRLLYRPPATTCQLWMMMRTPLLTHNIWCVRQESLPSRRSRIVLAF